MAVMQTYESESCGKEILQKMRTVSVYFADAQEITWTLVECV
jgi:hypothetical protein